MHFSVTEILYWQGFQPYSVTTKLGNGVVTEVVTERIGFF